MTRDTQIETKRYDLAVIGAGLAGICAAVAAARLGLKVALVNDRPVLGGNSSTEIRVHVGGSDKDHRWARESGILEEIRIEDRFRNHSPIISGAINQTWDQVLWEWVTREPDLDLYLNTAGRKAIMDGGSRIAAVICEQLGSEKTIRIDADYFIDSSGDGQVAWSAGADFRMGRESRNEFGEDIAPEVPDRRTMGSSILFRALDVGRPVKFERPAWAHEYPTEEDLPFRNHERITSGYWWIELGGEEDTIHDSEEIRDELWRSLYGVWDHIKNRGDHGADNLALEWVGAVPGKRESRRFVGDHILTQGEVESAVSFPDAVAYGGWPIDLHPPGGLRAPTPPAEMKKLLRPYGIPFGSLYSRNVENLMMAGRNASTTHVALGTTRLQATGAVMGQAVGTAAYLCRKHNVPPRDLGERHIQELQQLLLRNDCYVPNLTNMDAGDLAREGRATATSEMALEVVDLDSFVDLDKRLGQIFPMSEDSLETVSLYLSSEADVNVNMKICEASHWNDRSPGPRVAGATSPVPKGEGWTEFQLGRKVNPGFLWILLDPSPGVAWGFSKDEPIAVQRTEEGPWKRLGGSYLFRTTPASKPYGAGNVLSGCSRPESWTNIWISDPGQQLPQSIEIELARGSTLHEVRLTFDTDLDDLPVMGPAARCVKSYDLKIRTGDAWRVVAAVRENHHRLAIHSLDGLEGDALALDVLETWGDPSARVYEIRAY
jgi:hypothetical protein